MADLARARRRIEMRLHDARLVSFAEIGTGADSPVGAFQFGSYYSHRIANQFVMEGGIPFIMTNGFLQSHAYNLALAMDVYRAADAPVLHRALRHNFKKFFAECALNEGPALIARALLVETIAFEQGIMRPVFGSAARDPALAARARAIVDATTQLISTHELSHYFFDTDRAGWTNDVATLFDGCAGALIAEVAGGWPDDLREELACDVVAFARFIEPDAADGTGNGFAERARLAALAFLCFRELAGLAASAIATVRDVAPHADRVELGSMIRGKDALEFRLVRDAAFDRRCAAVMQIVERHLNDRGGSLFDTAGSAVPLGRETDALLRRASAAIIDTEPAGDAWDCATNDDQRGLARLLAESLTGHRDGDMHLLWRSKQFSHGGQPVDP